MAAGASASVLAGGRWQWAEVILGGNSYLGQNEVFGPIMSIIGFDSDDEAVAIANKSDFGLGGSIVSAADRQAAANPRSGGSAPIAVRPSVIPCSSR